MDQKRKKEALCEHRPTLWELRLPMPKAEGNSWFVSHRRWFVLHTTWNVPGALTGLKPSTGTH